MSAPSLETPTARSASGRWKPYPAYRDSGVEWLGEIPVDWEVRPLKRASTYVSRGMGPDYVDESEIRVLNQACIQWDGLHLENAKYHRSSTPPDVRSILLAGDLVMNSTGTGTLGRVAVFEDSGQFMADSHVTIVRVDRQALDERFLFYLLQSPLYQGYVYSSLVAGSTNQIELLREGLRAMSVIVPPRSAQGRIVAFLDSETAHIDALVANKQRLIELLQEKRVALINRAVTRGLDPTGPMKDSGVEWLGEIPVHWKVMRLKYAARLESGHTPSRKEPEYWVNCTIPWVSLADVGGMRGGTMDVIEDTAEMISEVGLAHSSARLLPAGTVILSRTASIGFSTILGRPMATTQDFANWVCGSSLRPRYLLQCLRSMSQEFKRLNMGSTHQTIYMPDIKQFVVPLPPLTEQEAIERHIGQETAKIDALIGKVREAIEKLKEYRTALISATVTGKIDVRSETEP